MVLLTMTPSIVDGLNTLGAQATQLQQDTEPTLANCAVGNPISHAQVLRLWKQLQSSTKSTATLESLLVGAKVYTPPPPPKAEKSPEYIALMARLRRDEDERAYERMINPTAKMETFKDMFPSAAQSYSAVNRPMTQADMGDDEVTLTEVHRQVMLIMNFVLSIAGVAGTLWVLARWWPLSARILLTLGGSIAVAIAEVGVYSAYMWRLGEAHKKDKNKKEIKEITQTWTVNKEEPDTTSVLIKEKANVESDTLRRREASTKAKS